MKWKNLFTIAGLTAFSLVALSACSEDNGGTGGGTAPSAPSSVVATPSGSTLTVTFTPGTGATSHRVDAVSAVDQTVVSATGAGSATSVQLTGLVEGDTYTVTVFAINSNGETASTAITIAIAPPATVTLSGTLTTDMTLRNETVYVLSGIVFVGEDVGSDGTGGTPVTLTIEPGTTIVGDVNPPGGARSSFLVINRGSTIIADANANRADKSARPNPEDVIVFTSSNPRGQRDRGDWGGLVINGRGRLNTGQEATGEGDSGTFGGPVDTDSSGILRGVRVEFAGDDLTDADQLNGIAFQGTGAGTTVDYVQVHYNKDDGTEPFGGAVTQTHMVMTGIGDDSFDGTDGYRGFGQFMIAQQRADDADQGFEISNGGDDDNAAPHSTAIFANATLIGAGGNDPISNLGGESDIGVDFREGSNFRVFNTIVTNFTDAGFCVEDAQTVQNANNRVGGDTNPESTFRFESNVLWSNGQGATPNGIENFEACGDPVLYTDVQNQAFFGTAGYNNILADPNLPASAFTIGSMAAPPNVVPTALPTGYVPINVAQFNNTAGLVMPVDGRTLQQTNYAGAVAPGTALQDAWYFGWTIWTVDGTDSRPNQNGN